MKRKFHVQCGLGEKDSYLSTLALTRSKNDVFILTPNTNPSEFVIELINEFNLEVSEILTNNIKNDNLLCNICKHPLVIRYSSALKCNIYICTNDQFKCGFISNNKDCLKSIYRCCKCGGVMIIKKKFNKYFYGCSNFKKGCLNTKKI